jgi:hypothetical protein
VSNSASCNEEGIGGRGIEGRGREEGDGDRERKDFACELAGFHTGFFAAVRHASMRGITFAEFMH